MATIITVHGTGATGPQHGDCWWQKGSPFEKHIRELIESEDGELNYEPLIWDGANSETSRRAAGKALLKRLRDVERNGDDYCVIGHSHGGSVIAAALFSAARRRLKLPRLRSWIAIGTPFLVAKKRPLLFNRIGFWAKSAYIFAITSSTLLAIFAVMAPMPEYRAFEPARSIAEAYFPAFLILLALGISSSRALFSKKTRVARRFNQYFCHKWFFFFHDDDEAIRGLQLAARVQFPIFRKMFLLSPVSLLALLLVPIAIIGAVTSEELMLWLYENLSSIRELGMFDELATENGQLKGGGRDIIVNLLVIGLAPFEIVAQIFSMPARMGFTIGPLPEWFVSNIYIAPAFLWALYFVVFYFVALTLVLAIVAIGALASLAISRVMETLTWQQLRASVFGDDHRGEAIIGLAPQPMWTAGGSSSLPKELSREISEFSDKKAAQSIARFRSALNVLAFAEGGHQKSGMLSEYLMWDELIHTSYFEVPRFRKLVAYAISTAEGFRATQAFKADPDYSLVAKWFEEIQPKTETAVQG